MTRARTTIGKRNNDYATDLLAGVTMNEHDRRNAERAIRNAERIVDMVTAVVDGSKALVRAVRSGFATPAKAAQ